MKQHYYDFCKIPKIQNIRIKALSIENLKSIMVCIKNEKGHVAQLINLLFIDNSVIK